MFASVLFLFGYSFAAPVQDNQHLYKRSPVNLKGIAVGALASSAAIGQTDAFNGIPKRPISASAVPGLKRFDQESMFSSPVESTNENVKLFAMEDPKQTFTQSVKSERFPGSISLTAEKQELMNRLFVSSAIGIEKMVQDALDDGAKVNWINKHGETSLMIAAKSGNFEVVQLLVENGADLNKQNIKGRSALFLASFYGFYDIVSFLIDKGADMNLKDRGGSTASLAAAFSGDLKMLKLLLKCKADVNAQNDTGNNPLIQASIMGNYDMVDYLINNGADLNVRDKYGMTAKDHAFDNMRLKVTMLLGSKGL